jgi:hypothetical protein
MKIRKALVKDSSVIAQLSGKLGYSIDENLAKDRLTSIISKVDPVGWTVF